MLKWPFWMDKIDRKRATIRSSPVHIPLGSSALMDSQKFRFHSSLVSIMSSHEHDRGRIKWLSFWCWMVGGRVDHHHRPEPGRPRTVSRIRCPRQGTSWCLHSGGWWWSSSSSSFIIINAHRHCCSFLDTLFFRFLSSFQCPLGPLKDILEFRVGQDRAWVLCRLASWCC